MGLQSDLSAREYSATVDSDGRPLRCVALGDENESRSQCILRPHNKEIVHRLALSGKNLLDIGCGRGEVLDYCLERGASLCVGIDISGGTVSVAADILERHTKEKCQFVTGDALQSLNEIFQKGTTPFEIITLFDSIEHIPRHEMVEMLVLIQRILSPTGVLVINTPSYKFDNDVIAQGIDKRNWIDCIDSSDPNKHSNGMQCNKYTVNSLQTFLLNSGFINLTEAHFFVNLNLLGEDIGRKSFKHRWDLAFHKGVSVISEYTDDEIEFPYPTAPTEWHSFGGGHLRGIRLLLEKSYRENFFADGNYDEALFDDLLKEPMEGKVVFDVGGFIGCSCLLFSKLVGPRGRVLSFEPNPWNRNRIFRNLSRNEELGGRIDMFPCALGNSNTRTQMTLSWSIDNGHSSTSRLSNCHTDLRREDLPESFYEEEVEIVTLDSFIEKNGVVPDVIKIDIEGAEFLMLQGAASTLKKYSPVLYIELHTQLVAMQCARILSELGYCIFALNEEDDGRVIAKAMKDESHFNHVSNFISNQDYLFKEEVSLLQGSNSRMEVNFKSLNKAYQALFNEHQALQGEHQALQGEHQALQGEHQSLQNSKAVRISNRIKKMIVKPLLSSYP